MLTCLNRYKLCFFFSHIQFPVLPPGLQIMADQGFANQSPILIPMSHRGNNMRGPMRTDFRSCRTTIERCFGIIKSSYCSVGTRRFRSNRFMGPLICNITAALSNRRKDLFDQIRIDLNLP